MGASWFEITGSGRSLNSTYNAICEAATIESGDDPYNGTISTTQSFNLLDLTSKFKSSGKSLDVFISDQVEVLNKRQCAAICIQPPKENTNKIKTTVNNIVTPGTKKWVLKYQVETYYEGEMIASHPDKTGAIRSARAYTEKHQKKTRIVMRKVLVDVDSTVATVDYKKSTSEQPGRYIFFGWAAE